VITMTSTLRWLLSCVLNKEHFYCLPSSSHEMTLVSTTSVWETNLVPNQALTQSSPLHPLYSLKWPFATSSKKTLNLALKKLVSNVQKLHCCNPRMVGYFTSWNTFKTLRKVTRRGIHQRAPCGADVQRAYAARQSDPRDAG
jgi:hypothetical protein